MSGILTAPGFRAAAVSAGIKAGNAPDLALMVSDVPSVVAGTFTLNKVCAAPVSIARSRVKRGFARAILANAGNANAMTGKIGERAARTATAAAARLLKIKASEALPASTGVIGVHLPVGKIERAMPKLVKRLKPDGFNDAARAIMTTDKRPKTRRVSFKIGKKKAALLGVAKGAGMLAPHMATMLAFLFTDAAVKPDFLRSTLLDAVSGSFNRVTVDGDTSTNDCVIIMANGSAGNAPIGKSSRAAKAFADALEDVCFSLAEMLVRDGEGATRIMDVRVGGAKNNFHADIIGRAIAESPLVKTALHGADPNWGRIAAAAGRSGGAVNPRNIRIKIGGLECVRGGLPVENFDEKRAAKAMRQDVVLVEVFVGKGKGKARFLSSDLTAEYVRINAHYRT